MCMGKGGVQLAEPLEVPRFCTYRHFYAEISSAASPTCQEGQSEKTFPIFVFSSRFLLFSPDFFLIFFFPIFGNFFAVTGGTLSPLAPPVPGGGHSHMKVAYECH